MKCGNKYLFRLEILLSVVIPSYPQTTDNIRFEHYTIEQGLSSDRVFSIGQDAADPGQILISEDCYEKIGQSFVCRKIGPVSLKNKADEIVLYEVVS